MCLSPARGRAGQPCPVTPRPAVTLRPAVLLPSLPACRVHSAQPSRPGCGAGPCPSPSPVLSQEPRWGVRAMTLLGLLVSCCPGELLPAAACGCVACVLRTRWVNGVLSGLPLQTPALQWPRGGFVVVRPRYFLAFTVDVCRPTFEQALPRAKRAWSAGGNAGGSREPPDAVTPAPSLFHPRGPAGVSCEPGSVPGPVGTAGDGSACWVHQLCSARATGCKESCVSGREEPCVSGPSRGWRCHVFGQCAPRRAT